MAFGWRGESGAMRRTILTLAWPTMLEQTMQSAMQYIDTAMVGALGTEATAAVGATTTIGWLVYTSIAAFSMGFLAMIAKACGTDDRETARRVSAQAVLSALLIGTVCTAAAVALSGRVPVWMRVEPQIRPMAGAYFLVMYLPMLPRTCETVFATVLRAAGDTKTPMKVGVFINGFNIVLNFLLIYPTRQILGGITVPGAGWGVLGAAAASAAAYTWGGVLMTRALWRHPVVSPRGMRLRADPVILRSCLRISLPNMVQRFATSLGYVVFAAMINSLGEVSTAAHTIANTVESAFYIPGYGMQTAAATLAGNAYGARDEERIRSLAGMFVRLETGLMLLSGGVLFAAAPALVGLFSSSEAVIALGSAVLRMVAASEPLYGFSIIMEGMMMGVGQVRIPFFYNISGMWLVRIIGTFLCVRVLGLGLTAAWGCMIGHNALMFALYLIAWVRGGWVRFRQDAGQDG